MNYTKLRVGALAAATLTIAAVACTNDSIDINQPKPADPIFQRYVALGNSITAGYQSSGINDSTQKESYARIVAEQMHTGYNYPALAGPGCAPPIANFLTRIRTSGDTVSTRCYLRNPETSLLVQNNVAVPGATSFDPTAATTKASNILTQLFLGGKTQVQRALDAQPTFISVWIGNNDVLDAATKGVTGPNATLKTAGITDTNVFKANYKKMIDQLLTQPGVKGILIGVVDVTQIPALFPAESLLTNATFKAKFDAIAGTTTTVLANCPGSGALVSYGIAGQIRSGAHPAVISCQKNVPAAPVGDWFVLDSTENRIFHTDIAAYNNYIHAKADSAGFAYLDPNPLLSALHAGNLIPTLPDFTNGTAPFGAYISLDGAHPTGKTHRIAANAIIDAINAKYHTTLAKVAP